MTIKTDTSNLLPRWQELLAKDPGLRARNAAMRLGVSEGQLVAARCGGDAMRLAPRYSKLLESLAKVGEVLIITRNDFAVHEKRGYYSNLQLNEHGGGAFDYNINLRYFFRHWADAFAVTDQNSYGQRKSLQFFDHDGTSVHKIYQTDNGDSQAWDDLLQEFRAEDQTPEFTLAETSEAYVPEPPKEADIDAVRKKWKAITDIHEFWFILREHKLRRIDALRIGGHDLARPVAVDAWRTVLQQAAKTGLPIMIFTASPGVSQIHTGPIYKLVEKNGWFNVLDPSFNLHLWTEAVSEVWVVYKPTASGGQTSLELYHENGQLISHVFGAVNLQAPELRGWRKLLADIPTLSPEGVRYVA